MTWRPPGSSPRPWPETLSLVIHAFLRGPGGNPELADALSGPQWSFRQAHVRLDRLRRCCGPEPWMRFKDPDWRKRIAAMVRDIRDGWQPPPLIAGTFGAWDMVLMDGNHRHAALLEAGRTEHPVILVCADPLRGRSASSCSVASP
jgi:hypothetical protein